MFFTDDDDADGAVVSFSLMENGGPGLTMISFTSCSPRANLSPLPTTWQRLHHGLCLVPQSAALTHSKKGSTEGNRDQTVALVMVTAASTL